MAGFEETGLAVGLRITPIAGDTAGDHTVTGIRVGDKLCSVLHFTPAAGFVDLSAEFTITDADTVNNTGGTDTSSDELVVFYWDNPNA